MHEIENKILAFALFCDDPNCEEAIKEKTGAKTLNKPLGQKELKGKKCIFCNKEAKAYFYFGKTY